MTTICTACTYRIAPSELPHTVWLEGSHVGERLAYHAACWIGLVEARRARLTGG